jgi:DNA modification methylase
LQYLATNGNLQTLGTNGDNKRAPVHRWFPFLVGFSNSLVKATINHFNTNNCHYRVFDPFMGSGTTAIACKELGVDVVGNETNEFLYDVCKAKIAAGEGVSRNDLLNFSLAVMRRAARTWKNEDLSDEHKIFRKCFYEHNLKKLVALRNAIAYLDGDEALRNYCFIALTRSLIKAARVGLNIPYVSWKGQRIPQNAFKLFEENISLVLEDIEIFSKSARNCSNVNVYLQDSKEVNEKIGDQTINLVFTSPPYLNNFDYGEALKIFMYFWKYVKDWKDITEKVRLKSVVSATTYYDIKRLTGKSTVEVLGDSFVDTLPITTSQISALVGEIRKAGIKRGNARKSFDFLTLLYFKDMYFVLKEIHRVLENGGLACLVVGDSAPYGVHVPTETILGNIALGLKFSGFSQKPIRERGIKWTTLKYRHNLRLKETLLFLRK